MSDNQIWKKDVNKFGYSSVLYNSCYLRSMLEKLVV